MANKIASAFKPKQNLPTKPLKKYVKKAGLWCLTTYTENGKQVQAWSIEEPVL